MQGEMIAAIGAVRSRIDADAESLVTPAIEPPMQPQAAPGNLFDSFRNVLESVDARERVASDRMAEVDSGRSDDLVGAMLASQEASLSFTMLMQVRNKVVGAMEDLIKLQL